MLAYMYMRLTSTVVWLLQESPHGKRIQEMLANPKEQGKVGNKHHDRDQVNACGQCCPLPLTATLLVKPVKSVIRVRNAIDH